MQRNDRWPEEYEPEGRSRPGSRRGSASLSRRSSGKKEKDGEKREVKKKSPVHQTASATSTPKKVKPQNLEFIVTGKQCLKKCDRANSLPGYHRRPEKKRLFESPRRAPDASHSSKSRETSLEDDMSLDLSQVSDFEDTNSKYGIKSKMVAVATSTPKPRPKPRSGSLQTLARDPRRPERDVSRDSLYKTSSSASPYRQGVSTELDYSSVSPECSGQSSADGSPRAPDPAATPQSQDPNVSSISSWQDCSSASRTAVGRADGEWSQFWADYNHSLGGAPVKPYYDQCPTPYRTEDIDLADLDFSTDGSRLRSPDDLDINHVIRTEGLHLSARETQNVIKCAHVLGSVLARALRRGGRGARGEQEEDPELELKKKNLTLDLKETNEPAPEVEEVQRETATTQTDISLPNTKSAPRIFEKILRQLSRTSLDDGLKALEAKAMENKGLEGKGSEVSAEGGKGVDSKCKVSDVKAVVGKDGGGKAVEVKVSDVKLVDCKTVVESKATEGKDNEDVVIGKEVGKVTEKKVDEVADEIDAVETEKQKDGEKKEDLQNT